MITQAIVKTRDNYQNAIVKTRDNYQNAIVKATTVDDDIYIYIMII